mmetsp:Transcript_10617/g.24112  ORF Transcript_10617/g.24112 Transcript_10617/m.24112 type:complete len:248 (+) Transcript_10617:165-908(+)
MMDYHYSTAFLVAAVALLGGANAIELTTDNFAEMTAGKTVFIKFFAPWCGHCKAMASDWEKLEADFLGHDVALIGEVDCTSDGGDEICEDLNVDGFPTLMWGEASGPESYEGPRSYAAMKAFADEFVTKPVCSLFNVEVCSDEDKAIIDGIISKSDEELLAAAEQTASESRAAEKAFEKEVDRIQNEYEQLSNQFNENIEKIKKDSNFKFVEQVMKKRNIANPFKNNDSEPDDDDDDDDDDMTQGEL